MLTYELNSDRLYLNHTKMSGPGESERFTSGRLIGMSQARDTE